MGAFFMTAKTVLMTGCSSGIGYAAAHGMRARGWRVFAACRQQADCDRLPPKALTARCSITQTRPASDAALDRGAGETGGTLDALYNNGAHGTPGAVEDLPTDALREIFESNFFRLA